jgi:arabinoxylan arabinofuranohydrolase
MKTDPKLNRRGLITAAASAALLGGCAHVEAFTGANRWKPGPTNPIFKDAFTADPAPFVYKDTLYVYVGHDQAKGEEMFTMTEWLVYSTKDMVTWEAHPPIMKPTDFKWAIRDAWASQVTEKNGKFYFYATVKHADPYPGDSIGVAVSDSPLGPFVDARGTALVRNDMTVGKNAWGDIDPTVFTDTDGTSWLMWGNANTWRAKLKANMIEIDGEIEEIVLPNYTEGPWLHKRGGLYYLTYAAIDEKDGWEVIAYATGPTVKGPWKYQGRITGTAQNSFTIHPGIIEFKGQWYFFYHNATLELNGQTGAIGRRSVCVEYLYYNPDGTIKPVTQTKAGISLPPAK